MKYNKSWITDIIGWDVKNWSESIEFWESHLEKNVKFKKGLELGANHGGLSIWLADKCDSVICSDINDPSAEAKKLHQKYSLGSKISYLKIDATDIDYFSEFDLICYKSMLGGIGRNINKNLQKKVINEIYKALKPGGFLLFAENLVSSPLHRQLRKRFVNWGDEWFYISIDTMQELTQKFSNLSYITVGFMGAFGRTEWQRNLFGIVDRVLFNFIIPESWRYIMIGVARK